MYFYTIFKGYFPFVGIRKHCHVPWAVQAVLQPALFPVFLFVTPLPHLHAACRPRW